VGDGAHAASIVLEFTLCDADDAHARRPPTLVSCQPAELESQVRALLQLPGPAHGRAADALHGLTLGAPMGSRTVPAVYGREACSYPTQVACSPNGQIAGIQCVRTAGAVALGVVPAAQWAVQRERPAPDQGVPMRVTGWDRFAPVAK
jgi:hypothetical protein